MGTRESFKKRILIDWVNSLPVDSCLLVSDISEFESGEIICDIINYIIHQNKREAFFNKIERSHRIDSIYNNWDLALSSMAIFDKYQSIPIEEIVKSDEIMLEILTSLYDYVSNDAKTIPKEVPQGRERFSENSGFGDQARQRRTSGSLNQRLSAKPRRDSVSSRKGGLEDRSTLYGGKPPQSPFRGEVRQQWVEPRAKISQKDVQGPIQRCFSEKQVKGGNGPNEYFNVEDLDLGTEEAVGRDFVPVADQLDDDQRRDYAKKMRFNNKKILGQGVKRSTSRERAKPKLALGDVDNTIKMASKHLSTQAKKKMRNFSISKISRLSSNRGHRRPTSLSRRPKSAMRSSSRPRSNRSTAPKKSKHPKIQNQKNTKKSIISNIQKPMDVVIDPITSQQVEKIKTWLLDHLFCHSMTNFRTLHLKSKNGAFIFDLINKIQRKKVLKGKSVKTPTGIKVTYAKIMDYLKQFEKFNPRYLGASYYLINGHYDVFWGFLEDVYFFSVNKISKMDKRYNEAGGDVRQPRRRAKGAWARSRRSRGREESSGRAGSFNGAGNEANVDYEFKLNTIEMGSDPGSGDHGGDGGGELESIRELHFRMFGKSDREGYGGDEGPEQGYAGQGRSEVLNHEASFGGKHSKSYVRFADIRADEDAHNNRENLTNLIDDEENFEAIEEAVSVRTGARRRHKPTKSSLSRKHYIPKSAYSTHNKNKQSMGSGNHQTSMGLRKGSATYLDNFSSEKKERHFRTKSSYQTDGVGTQYTRLGGQSTAYHRQSGQKSLDFNKRKFSKKSFKTPSRRGGKRTAKTNRPKASNQGTSYMKNFKKKVKNEKININKTRASQGPQDNCYIVEKGTNQKRFVDLEVEVHKDGADAPQNLDYSNLIRIEKSIKKWLKTLGFMLFEHKEVFEDPIRNGYILCLLASKIYSTNILGVCKKPKTIRECLKNVESAFIIFRENQDDFSYNLLWKTEDIVKGDPCVIWPVFASLKQKYEKSGNSINLGFGPSQGQKSDQGSKLSSVNTKKLPYTSREMTLLKDSILMWLISLGLFSCDNFLPSTFDELLMRLSDGVVLVKLVESVLKVKIKGIHFRPNGRSNCLHNIRKALDKLREQKKMSRRFLWKIEKIYEMDSVVCLGLLEDLHRFSDGLPRRRDPDYFKDGPYIVKVGGLEGDDFEEEETAKKGRNGVSEPGFESELKVKSFNGSYFGGAMPAGKSFTKFDPRLAEGVGAQTVVAATPNRNLYFTQTGSTYQKSQKKKNPSLTENSGFLTRLESKPKSALSCLNQGRSEPNTSPVNVIIGNMGPESYDLKQFYKAPPSLLARQSYPQNVQNLQNQPPQGLMINQHPKIGRFALKHDSESSGVISSIPGGQAMPHQSLDQIQGSTIKINPLMKKKRSITSLTHQNHAAETNRSGGMPRPTNSQIGHPQHLRYNPGVGGGHAKPMMDTFAKTETFSELHNTEVMQDIQNYEQQNAELEDSSFVSNVDSKASPPSFAAIKKVIRLLVYLDMPKVIERETWDSLIWTQFSDGLVLAEVLGKLSSQSVSHIEKNPRTTAACLNNIKRCLRFLSQGSNKVDVNKLYCEDLILKGEPMAIAGIFGEVYKAYGIVIKRLEKQRVKYSAVKYKKLRDEVNSVSDKLSDLNIGSRELINHPRNAY